jgi:hypothetical protein
MIDANSQFFAILTNVGMAKQANADALGVPWKFTHMGVGDANETDPIPSATQTSLINERRRRPLNQVRVDPVNPAVIIAEQIIPADEGGFWIREIGLYDGDGDLVAVANCAPSFKPVLSQGSGRTQVVRMNFIVASTGNITLKIDPAVVLATREYVDTKIQEELYKLDNKQSVLVATTANIALAGLQTIDGVAVPAGARVLVKNQTVAKDNGIYVAAAAVWTRAPDADANAEVTSALLTSVEQGATLADTRWQLVTDGLIVVGTTALTFQNVTQGFAPINSPALINPTANTPPLFDYGLALATTEFVRRASGNYRAFTNATASAVLTTAAVGTLVTCIGAFTLTMPAANTVPSGGAIHFRNIGNAVVTVACAGTDTINGGNGNQPTSIDLQPGATLELSGNGANAWWAAGSAQLQFSKVFGSTPPQFDASKLLVNAEFVQRALGSWRGFVTLVTSRTLTAADIGNALYIGANGVVITLPSPGSLGAPLGSAFTVFTTSANGSLVPGAGVAINHDLPDLANLKIKSGQSATIMAVSPTIWQVINSNAELGRNADFASILGVNGAQKLPGGTIIQRCTGTTTSGIGSVTFPMAFPTACREVVAFESGAGSGWGPTNLAVYGATAKTQNGVTIKSAWWNGANWSAGSGNFDLIAIGE